MTGEPHDDALAEIARIDFLLDELARAVERGEVHHASYEIMAPRYLDRRAELVALITGEPRASGPGVQGSRGQLAVPDVTPAGGHGGGARSGAGTVPSGAAPTSSGPPSAPVDWTTVLLFLGAFLVIVAAAIFSVAVWRDLGTGAKIAFMGSLTTGFYVAGWWARAWMGLRVGSVALTTVASALLLFVGWIVIDGYRFSGPLPWAGLMLVCSAVYWFTETRLESRFFGVTGAAAQIAWWWLLGAGLGLPTPTRIAGIALVALGWHLVASRVSGPAAVSSLARVLEAAAPVVGLVAASALLVDLAALDSADVAVVAAAAVTSLGAGLVLHGTSLARRPVAAVAAALVQAPLLLAAWTATGSAGRAWWVFGVFAGAALVYYLAGLGAGGAAFIVVGLAAEGLAVIEFCRVVEVRDPTTIVALAALASVWALTARLAPRLESVLPERRATLLATATESAAWTLLAGASLALLYLTGWAPLETQGVRVHDALPYLGVLAAWAATVSATRRGAGAWAGSVWAHVTLLVLLAWAAPRTGGHVRAVALVLLSGVWRAAASQWARRYGEAWARVGMWSARVSVIGLATLGTAGALLDRVPAGPGMFGGDRLWDPVLLVGAAAVVLFVAPAFARPPPPPPPGHASRLPRPDLRCQPRPRSPPTRHPPRSRRVPSPSREPRWPSV